MIAINPDFSAIITTEDGLMECRLPPYNPFTMERFENEEQTRACAESIKLGDPRFFTPIPTAEELEARRLKNILVVEEAIKQERDRRMYLGVQLWDNWFHSDVDSRIKFFGLKDLARDALAAGGTMETPLMKLGHQIEWKIMGKPEYYPVTCQFAFDIVAAVGDLDAMLTYIAKSHFSALGIAPDPLKYNYFTNWPLHFGEEPPVEPDPAEPVE